MSRPMPPRSLTWLRRKRRTRRHKVRRPHRPATAKDRNRHSTRNSLTLIIRNPSLTGTTLADCFPRWGRLGLTNQFFNDSWVVDFGGPTMAGMTSNWEDEFGRWLKPFLDLSGHNRSITINCSVLLLLASGMRCRWRQRRTFERRQIEDYDLLRLPA